MEERPYFAVLHAAKKNVGDFLIRDRSQKLLRHFRPDRDLRPIPSWKPVDEHLEEINKAEALIIMGGPGVHKNIYPGVYPLVSDIDKIKVPIYLMGVGSYMYPFTQKAVDSFSFTSSTQKFLSKCGGISVRDAFTKNLIESKGFSDVVMSGCPVWYNVDFFNKPLVKPKQINTILYSFPQKHYFHDQAIDLAKKVKSRFPNAHIKVGFNRGLEADKFTNTRDANRFQQAASTLEKAGFEIVNYAYELDKLESEKDCDLHIGYRLHSHIFFASMRKPSYVIAEDSRSYGHFTTLGLPGFLAYDHSLFAEWLPYIEDGMIRGGTHKILPVVKIKKNLAALLLEQIDRDIETNFAIFEGLDKKIDAYAGQMESFLKKLP